MTVHSRWSRLMASTVTLALGLTLAGVGVGAQAAAPAQGVRPAASDAEPLADPEAEGVIDSRIVAIPKASTDPGEVAEEIATETEALGVDEVTEVVENPGPSDPGTVVVVETDPEAAVDLISQMRESGLYEAVDYDQDLAPDYTATPNDPGFSTYDLKAYPGVNATPIWPGLATAAAPSTASVAVIDTGFLLSHPDFAGSNVLPGYDYYNNTSDVSPCLQQNGVYNGHGTATASNVGAVSNNGQGVASVGFDNQVYVYKVGVPYPDTCMLNIGAAINAVYDAVNNKHVKVISMSFGGTQYNSSFAAAIAYAVAQGVSVVASAGNESSSGIYYPADYPDVISVAATNSSGARAYFTNWNDYVTVSAPGLGVAALNLNGSWGGWNGTSFSAPLTAGAVAVLLRYNPALTVAQRTQALVSTSVGSNRIIDLAAAVASISSSPTVNVAPASLTVSGAGGTNITSTSITTNAASGWTLTGTPSWITPSRTTGPSGATTVSFSVQANPGTAQRVANLTINAAGATPVTLTITQDQPDCAASTATTCQFPSMAPSSFTSTLSPGNDVDWIRYVAPASGSYVIRSTTVPTTHDVYGYLYNSAGAQLAADDDSGSNADFLINYSLTAGQTYYVGIRNYSSTTTVVPTYTISITLQTPAAALSLSPTSASLAATGGTASTSVTTNVAGGWALSGLPSWVSASRTTGSTGTTSVTFTAAANTSTSARTGTITFSASGATSQTFTITQAGSASLSLYYSSLSLPAAGGSNVAWNYVYFTPASGTPSWSITSIPSWVTASPTSGTGSGYTYLTVAANTSTSARSGTITVSAAGLTSVSFTVTQAGTTSTLSLSATSASVATTGGTAWTTVTTNVASGWSLSGLPSWVSASRATGPAGATNVTFTAAANTSTSARTGTITISASGATPQIFTITQAGSASLSLYTTAVSVPAAGGANAAWNYVYFTPGTGTPSWSVTSAPYWITVSPTTGTSTGYIYLTASANTSTSARTGTITISASGLASQIFTITQAASASLSLYTSAVSVPAAGGANAAWNYVYFTPGTGTPSWSVTSAPYWITVSPTTGTSTGYIYLTASANTSASARTGTITLSAAGLTPVSFTVTQAGSASLSLYTSSLSVGAGGGAYVAWNYVYFTPATGTPSWTVTSIPSWIAATPTRGTTSGYIDLSVATNTSASARTGTITISANGLTPVSFTVTQAGSASLSLYTTAISVPAAGGTNAAWNYVYFTPATGTPSWSVTSMPSWMTVSPTAGTGSSYIYLTLPANTSASARTGTITISANGLTPVSFTVTQAGSASLSLYNSSVAVPAAGGSSAAWNYVYFTPATGTPSWYVTSAPSWITVTPTTGSSSAYIYLTAAANTSTSARTGVITVAAAGLTPVSFVVTQAGGLAGCGASTATTCQIPSGTSGTFSSRLSYGAQVDWVRFIPSLTGTYVFQSSTVPVTHDVYGYLFNSAGTQLAYNDDSAGNMDFLITYSLTAGQTYYVAIRNYSSGTTVTPSYTITAARIA